MNNSRQDIRLAAKDEVVLITGRSALEKKYYLYFVKDIMFGRVIVRVIV